MNATRCGAESGTPWSDQQRYSTEEGNQTRDVVNDERLTVCDTPPSSIPDVPDTQDTRAAALALLLGLESDPYPSLGSCNTHLRPDDIREVRMALVTSSLDERRELDDEGRGRESGGGRGGGSWGDEKQR